MFLLSHFHKMFEGDHREDRNEEANQKWTFTGKELKIQICKQGAKNADLQRRSQKHSFPGKGQIFILKGQKRSLLGKGQILIVGGQKRSFAGKDQILIVGGPKCSFAGKGQILTAKVKSQHYLHMSWKIVLEVKKKVQHYLSTNTIYHF